jgi:hypothetical protein
MAGTKYGKYIITEVVHKEEAAWTPVFKPEEYTQMPFVDNRVIKGAFYVETAWFWPPLAASGNKGQSHQHDFAEVLAFFGSDAKNPNDLGGRMEFQINGENHVIDKSCLIFIPPQMPHGPPVFTKIDRPIFHFACATGTEYL